MSLIEEVADLAAKYNVGVTANLVSVEMTILRNEGDRAAWYARPEYATLPAEMVAAWVERDRVDRRGEEKRSNCWHIFETVFNPGNGHSLKPCMNAACRLYWAQM